MVADTSVFAEEFGAQYGDRRRLEGRPEADLCGPTDGDCCVVVRARSGR